MRFVIYFHLTMCYHEANTTHEKVLGMKTKLSFRELLAVGSMLFGLFFGAGNLIFPASMGQLAGSRVLAASAGLLGALPAPAQAALPLGGLLDAAGRWLPLYTLGLGWLCPALAGLAAGLALRAAKPKRQ